MDAQASKAPAAGDTLVLGFGTSVAMWFLGYLCRISPTLVPNWALGVALLACLFAGGFAAGRLTERGWRAGLASGLLSSTINLLILGSLLGGPRVNQVVPSALWWLPGSLLLGVALGSGGAALGAIGRRPLAPGRWTGTFADVAVAATLLQVFVGGVVTGDAAGLAVADWPNSFGYNMFLYPLSRMTGGIYFEHAHRLFGTLIGLTTVVFAVYVLRVERRAWVKRLALLAVLVVIVQGVLGGLRVTGTFTLSTSRAAMEPSVTLAIVHGVFGPIFLALMVALAVVVSATWVGERPATVTRHAHTDRVLGTLLVIVVLLQLVLGAVQRHLSRGLLVHITFAVVVLGMCVLVGTRLWGMYEDQPLLQRIGTWLFVVAAVQVMLGVAAFFAVQAQAPDAPRTAWEVFLTTVHQVGGSVLLGCAVLAALWSRRLLAPAELRGEGGA